MYCYQWNKIVCTVVMKWSLVARVCCSCRQEQLFNSIQEGFYEFPDREWSDVSSSAKDLIKHLLVRDPHLRYSANEVLRHPWLTMESPQAQLATPRLLMRSVFNVL